MINNDNLELAAFEAVELLKQKKLKVATAESCTSGMLSSFITSVSGSSEIFELGISAYSSRIKEEALSVPSTVLKKFGAISKQTAMYLAKNVRSLADSDIGIGITGNAGPTSDENKPIGLVYVAIADKDGYFVKELRFSSLNSRDKIRALSSLEALNLIKDYAEEYPTTPSYFIPFETNNKNASSKKNIPLPTNTFLPLDDDEDIFERPFLLNFDDFNYDSKPETEKEDISNEISLEEAETAKEEVSVSSPENEKEEETEKKNFFVALWDKLKIDKSNGIKDIITKIVFLVSLVAFLSSAFVLGFRFISDNKQQKIINEAQSLYEDIVDKPEDVPKLFEVLIKENPEIKAWIKIKNVDVDHAICQADNNDFYLHHNMYKSKSRYGSLFFDYRNDTSSSDRSQNLTVYGHNMKDGSMFGTLKKYKDLDFYLDNPTFTVTTPDGFEEYAIFSIMIMNAVAEDDNDYLYGFTRSNFSSSEHFMSWISESLERSIITTDIQIESDDQIMTLVTCEDDKLTFPNARLVLMAKKLEPSETNEFAVNATVNPNPRYPQAWYDAKGLDGYKPSKNNTSSDSLSSESTESTEASSDVLSSDEVSNSVSSQNTASSVSSKPATSSQTTTSNQATTSSQTATSSQIVTSAQNGTSSIVETSSVTDTSTQTDVSTDSAASNENIVSE